MDKLLTHQSALIELIYQFVNDDNAPQQFLNYLVDELGFHGGNIAIQNTRSLAVSEKLTAGISADPTYQSEHLRRNINSVDIWAKQLLQNPNQGQFLADHQMVDRAVFDTSEVKAFLDPFEVGAAIGAHWQMHGDEVFRLSLLNHVSLGLISQQQQALLNSLSPHLTRALKFRMQFEFNELKSHVFQQLESHNQSVAIVSVAGQVLAFNTCFDSHATQQKILVVKNDKLQFKNPAAQQVFSRYLQQLHFDTIATTPDCSLTLASGDNDANYLATFTPILLQNTFSFLGLQQVLVFKMAPEYIRLTDKRPRLMSQTGLSPVELETGLMLAQGNCIKQIARSCNKSEHTVRTQVKKIQRKLGVSSQAEIVAHLFKL
ncbi:hypothetical protein C2869_12385 [Saccharobesus litoralis]|uniref:HTH luxR-type domain-containing protein n=1 Tax=Saccharobesus litoralis TaxID=2172099 RepID=A0A2S0VSM2_9ALTE|nr:helix-turn-helix transcriptional regulator [Saccharobesus litoralis]AWB67183.1 hypothetical protein C2869_12385 [Saccharobesus litoralis]